MAGSSDSAIGLLGVNLDANDASAGVQGIAQGTEVITNHGKAVYAMAAGNSPGGSLCTVAPPSAAASASVVATLVSTGNVNSAPGFLAVNQVDVSASRLGWFYTEIRRSGKVRVAADCQPFVPLYTTTTGGVVDDAVVSAGRIEGLRVLASAASASSPAAVFGNLTRVTQDIA